MRSAGASFFACLYGSLRVLQVSKQPKLMRFDNGEVGWMTEDKKAKTAASGGAASTPRGSTAKDARSTRDSMEFRAVELRKKANLTSFQLKVRPAPWSLAPREKERGVVHAHTCSAHSRTFQSRCCVSVPPPCTPRR